MMDDSHDRRRWTECWRHTVWERAADSRWLALEEHSHDALVIVSAWNPGGRRLPEAVNRARDGVLHQELLAIGLRPLRVRGRSPDHSWCEEGWRFAHLPARTGALLRRYGQLAGWITEPAGCRYVWGDPAR
jgi:hypothetical protein